MEEVYGGEMGVSQGGLRYWRAGLGDELRDDHSYDSGDETDEDEMDGDTSHEGRHVGLVPALANIV
ncbi:hypothetical protein U9M48_003022 [Paspalum notatum var. saurae]|uniref:Uncharacterized protein n=1 Tax=Paspalum notatum var. saurae TaxID=547442 RepID=A0AAQ3PS47_PASNO